jgi:hypothetical protein
MAVGRSTRRAAAAARSRWVGQVVAATAEEAIEAAVEFKTDVRKLIAVCAYEIAQ